jgi:hypothetical protein
MWMSESARLTVTFWLIASYTFKLYRKFPYLRIKSPDKNTLIDLVAELVFNPLIASDVSPAALYRVVEKFTPTLLLDEFDNKEQVRELSQLLNAGFDANRSALRFNMDKDCAERFRTYCPKVIASIKPITDTTESRCLPIDLQRVPSDAEDKLVELCDINPERFQTIKRKILAWVEDNLPKIKASRPVRPSWLHTRDWDMLRPCYVVGAVLGEWGIEMVNQAATGVFGERVAEQSLAIEILACIRKATKLPGLIFEARKSKKGVQIRSGLFIRTQTLVDYCNGHEENPWADWKTGDKTGLTTARFAKELREHFKLKADQIWHEKKYLYGYWVEPFQKLFDSFLPPEDDEPDPTDAGTKKEDSVPGEKHPLDHNVRDESPSESGTSARCDPKMDDNNVAVQNQTTTCETSSNSGSYPSHVVVQGAFSSANENSFLALDCETSAELVSKTKVSRDALDPHRAELRILSAALPDGKVIVHDFRKGPLPDYFRAAIATMPLIAHGAAGLQDSNDLGPTLKRHLGVEIPKELGHSDWGGMLLTDQQLEYCRNDVAHLHRLQEALQAKLANPADEHGDGTEGVDLVRVAALEMALIPLVTDIRLRGIKVDRGRLEQTLASYKDRAKRLATELRNELGAPKLNLSSPAQLIKVLRADGLEIADTSKETLSASPHPVAGRILEYRRLAGLGTAMKGWLENLDSANHLYPPLNSTGAETGRFSCKDPNLLGVSREPEIRRVFVADDGCVLIESDFSNIEMRIAAWFARDPRMLEVFRNGGDIHGETAESGSWAIPRRANRRNLSISVACMVVDPNGCALARGPITASNSTPNRRNNITTDSSARTPTCAAGTRLPRT